MARIDKEEAITQNKELEYKIPVFSQKSLDSKRNQTSSKEKPIWPKRQ